MQKLLTYNAVIAWILKSCTKEFSQYSVQFICDNCLTGDIEISQRSVHQDYLDKNTRLNGNQRIDGLNTEANSINEQTVYYDIRFKACLPDSDEPVQLIINLEIQLNDTPGYPLVTRGFYYCARMISEQYGTVFTDEHYEKIQKYIVYGYVLTQQRSGKMVFLNIILLKIPYMALPTLPLKVMI